MSDANHPGIQSPHTPVEERFGALLAINPDALTTLASDIRRKLTTDTFTTATLIERLTGSNYLIHVIEFDDKLRYVIRLPCSGRPGHFTEPAKRALIARVEMMRFIRKRTMIPMPEIYDFNASAANVLEAPYVVEGFISGTSVADVWFDESGPMSLEEKRLRILDSVAEAMAQLRGFYFDKIGTMSDTGIQYAEYGPYESTVEFLRDRLAVTSNEGLGSSPYEIGCRIFLDMMISCLPLSTKRRTDDRETFVLAVPQFESKNIRLDEYCNVTGIIDWEGAHTMPRFLGYAVFPGWITRDLDPVVYGWPYDTREDSPEQLKRYRLLYNRKMQGLLRGVGDARFVNKTHIFEAILAAIENRTARIEIVRTLVAKAFPASLDTAARLIEDAGDGELLRRDSERLKGGFEALLSIPR
ncbi:uncharacterized protein BO80DRAFT_408631 [Aspergillus ibericus CBS 121593]|uniref:Aminoglycoside phosphotransferase domain-containing protein n=1 Tax=Aspergillus ibericus CBS 121593 TaxID=1448316 RepID=A0A395GXR7_9EURO|nr:hypothetical protein BO80DRAFT_408631 [Aspergillus ibericus CBS 121593]RAL00326.1 hypothetical protein BO80DRAFT_408631 [Aspergillus ibericus CBS 121593]